MQCTGLALVLLAAFTQLCKAAQHHKDSYVMKGKICIGTSGRMSVPANRDHHYQNLRDRYINCTYVDGNLELVWLLDSNMDLSFLKEIREVTGYVLISHVNIRHIVLPNLMIIRGRNLFQLTAESEEYSLLVARNTIEVLELPALRDILAGGVGFIDNDNLCYINTINWEEILAGYLMKPIIVFNSTLPERRCPPCHKSCVAGCWGPGELSCQKFSKINCSPQCHQGRCFGPNPRECCHLFCAGGCSGPTQSDCLACKNFDDNGVCKQECPPMRRYNPATYSWESNPEGKYAYGATCVKNCPEHLLRDSGACVRSCPDTKKAIDGECVSCDGPCPKNCQGVRVVHSGNIDTFRGCTVIEGSLTILDQTFDGFQDVYPNFTFGLRYPKMHPNELEVFSTLKEVTGFVNIQATHPDFRNLSFFRNLEIIDGRQLTEFNAALYIVKTSLQSLNLRSLRKVRSGSVAILENSELCFASEIQWPVLMRSSTGSVLLQRNAVIEHCRKQGLVCDEQCSSEGCWSSGPDQCLSCKSYKLKDTCVSGCNTTRGIYDAGNKICEYCDEECLGECLGPGPSNCTQCRNARDGPYCVSQCPVSKYNENRECMPCHENCANGCTGPRNTVGPGGCKSCDKAIVSAYDPNIVEQCLKAEEPCPDGYYQEYSGPHEEGIMKSLTGKSVCRKCHHRCKNCTAYGIHITVCDCLKYSAGEQCEDSCPRDHYPDNTNFHCVKCAEECRGCTGPTSTECQACRNYRVYLSSNRTLFNCTASCPADKPYKVFDDNMEDPYCSDVDPIAIAYHGIEEEHLPAILGGIVGCILLLTVFAVVFGYQWIQRVKTKENTMMMTMRMTGFEDNEPLKPTNVKPNLAKLRIVKEAELRKGGILGYGAFGTVYKGVWVPEGENVKIPVAIKVLRDGTCPNNNKEILEEAYFMASVDHPNLLKLLAVCMASQLMLVTQLMPLGCLLDYVRSNKDKIGSKPLLSWCAQIARGMAYLEELRMVHRDLALRNVLLQTPGCIKITDFGLAKFLDTNEEEYKAEGGKMPIKWLALECIQHRVFTHKSDVWAFGVTVWELLTYGARPYENTPAREVPDLLEKGERLPQPSICTIDVYMLMIKCWMLDAESRPTFKELADQFSKMARDPGRFLVVKGDKLLQLPSYSAHDIRELIKSIGMTADVPGVVMDAEQYLHPKLDDEQRTETDSIDKSKPPENRSTPSTPIGNPQLPELMPNVPVSNNSTMWYNGQVVSDQPPPVPRYCPDPLMNGMTKVDLYKYDPNDKYLSQQPALPVDEEDYLMPASCSRGPSVRYMDLIGDANLPETVGVRPISHYHYIPDFIPVRPRGMDNLEYHMMNDSSANNQQQLPPFQRLPSNSTSEETEYMTTKRELLPLTHHRNETTV
ncbi:epidermal growth factor receptor-like [Argiope bruennichi]|nr:epidermal growth factor receptor-like [Argiope bruennichi]XP_055943821.1 epidermal growth factor receptor-like [Argiope bruennichi]XP_055943822.1 epidermal growth factor receptor-like [Argiope bruennichi]XP_055943823.1 epidermal growth factor receptor-like [Argiope bruennichi]